MPLFCFTTTDGGYRSRADGSGGGKLTDSGVFQGLDFFFNNIIFPPGLNICSTFRHRSE